MENMVEKRAWSEFRNNGFLFMVNQLLHFFGWAIVFVFDEKGAITEVYPARVKFRGFDEKSTDAGYNQVGTYMKDNSTEIAKDLCQEQE